MQRKRVYFKNPDLTIWIFGAFFSFLPILIGALFEMKTNGIIGLFKFVFVNPDIVYFCVSISLVAYGDIAKAVCLEGTGGVRSLKLLFLHVGILVISSLYYALFEDVILNAENTLGFWFTVITNCMFVICVIAVCVNTYKLKKSPNFG